MPKLLSEDEVAAYRDRGYHFPIAALSASEVIDFRRKLAALRLLLERRQTELAKRGERLLRAKRERLERLRLQLEERNPRQILQRGYAIVTDAAGRVLISSDQVLVGNIVNVELHQGKLTTEVKAKEQP